MHTPVTFLYEDADLAIVDKAPGVAVIPAPAIAPAQCLRDRVAAALGAPVWVVHRLDRDTSGVVVFARSAAAHRALSMAFEARRVEKRYLALTLGVPVPASGSITVALHEARRGKARPATPGEPGAREALTGYEVTRTWHAGARAVSLATLTPRTGRHHQIRVHLRAIGTPIAGDPLYGGALAASFADLPLPRLALHAASIDVPHPSGGRRVSATAPWPADLGAVTAWLDTQWPASGTTP